MNKLFYYLFKPLMWLVSLMPFWFLYLFSDFLFLIIYYVIGYRKDVVQKNLSIAFPNKSPEEKENIAREFYSYFCDLVVETIKMSRMNSKEMKKRARLVNPELLDKFKEQNIILLLGHYGSWEWASAGFELGTDMHILVIYKPLSNPYMDRYLYRIRSRFGQGLTSMKNSLRNMLKAKDQVTATAFVGDQRPAAGEGIWLNFFGQETNFLPGAEKISAKLKLPVVFVNITRPKRGFYEINFEIITETPQATSENEITAAYVKKLETQIRQTPYCWLWSHDRWKHKQKKITQEMQC